MGGSSHLTISCPLDPAKSCPPVGVYGALGVPASGNGPGGRANAALWKDTAGNIWLFGGFGYDSVGNSGFLNDLWEFNPSTQEWTWMAGSSTLPASPALGMAGVYGTLRTPASGNLPGSRQFASTSTDGDDTLWLFGGDGLDSSGLPGWLNDLWKFTPSTGLWTWMSGSDRVPYVAGTTTGGQPGIYGVQGVAAPDNVPGGRESGSQWSDGAGNLWLFGGTGYDSADNWAGLNDLWEFNPSIGEWAWMDGSSTVPPPLCSPGEACVHQSPSGVYGTLGIPSADNVPGGRSNMANWTDAAGNFWLFGGSGADSAGNGGSLNDVWMFSPSANEWTWIDGASTLLCSGGYCFVPGDYGVLGVSASSNAPGSRSPAAGSSSGDGVVWVFGGLGYDSTGTAGYLNDLWAFGNPTVTPAISLPSGTYIGAQSVSITDANTNALIYYTTDGATPTVRSNLYSTSITINRALTLKAIAVAPGFIDSALATASYTFGAAPTVTVTLSSNSIQVQQAVQATIVVSGGMGNTTPTGSVTLTCAGYSSGPITLSGGSAAINIFGNTLGAGTDTLTATYTPDASSIALYTSATGTAAITVTVPNPAPVLSTISPAIATAGSATFTLTVTGSDFVSGSTVYWGSSALATTLVGATQLTAQVPAADIPTAGTDAITVQTPAPGGGTSNPLQFVVDSAGVAAPSFATTTATIMPGASATYAVTLPSGATSVTASCLNLPTAATCSYSSSTGQLTIASSASTPAGAYPITVVFTETMPETAAALVLLPVLLLPLAFARKRIRLTASLGLLFIALATYVTACGGGGSSSGATTTTQQVTAAATVSLIVQ